MSHFPIAEWALALPIVLLAQAVVILITWFVGRAIRRFAIIDVVWGLTEKRMEGRPGWDEYKARTSGFFPLPPKRS